MFAAAIEVDILCNRGVEPSVDDWQTCGDSCGKIAGGRCCHDILRQTFLTGLPSWASMLPENDHDASKSDEVEQKRMYIQKKSW